MGHKEDLNKLWKKNKIHAFYAVTRKKKIFRANHEKNVGPKESVGKKLSKGYWRGGGRIALNWSYLAIR